MFRISCALAIVVGFTLSAAADIPPPPPERGFKRVPYEHIMKLETELPAYKFYSFQRLGLGGDETIGTELQLGIAQGIVVPASSSPSVRTGVVAVPEKVMDELKSKENLAKLLSRDNREKLPAGVVVHETHGEAFDIRMRDPRMKVENVITISADEQAGVKFTAKETPAPASNSHEVIDSTGSRPPWTTLIAGVAASLAVVSLGLWYASRLRRADQVK